MPEYAIFLDSVDPKAKRPREVVRDHCAHLDRLDAEGRLIAAGPFADATDGGMILGSFSNLEEAESFAHADPFVRGGYSRARVRPWEWSHRENGHLGTIEPRPGGHPRFLTTLPLRATTRRSSGKPIADGVVRSLLLAALAAPSEFNLQPWRPIVCRHMTDRRRLQRCCFDQPQVGSAALAVVCAVDPLVFEADAPRAADEFIARGRYPPEQREDVVTFIRSCYRDPRNAAIRNGTIFGHQLLLAGVSRGLAGFWLAGFDEEAVRKEFRLPTRAVIAGVVGLGWAEAPGPPMPRQPLELLVGWGHWPDPAVAGSCGASAPMASDDEGPTTARGSRTRGPA